MAGLTNTTKKKKKRRALSASLLGTGGAAQAAQALRPQTRAEKLRAAEKKALGQ